MVAVAIIGGTGLNSLNNLELTHKEMINTPYGPPSAPLVFGEMCGKKVVFLARHGGGHTIPPHQVNYRANIWALKEVGVTKIISVAAVGGMRDDMKPGIIAFPDQIIDYTYSRKHTFYESDNEVKHIDFTSPYCQELRDILINAARNASMKPVIDGTYGATQGPRLETAAEIKRMIRDGCDIVGMTGMPEASLAREADLCYATCAVVANWAAGLDDDVITMEEIERNLKSGMSKVIALLNQVIPAICTE